MARIYVASSWRNVYQSAVVSALREMGHQVYDFKADDRSKMSVPTSSFGTGVPAATAFSWKELDHKWKNWTPAQYRRLVQSHTRAAQGFMGDFRGMEWADTCVLVLPAGNSAHLELGYMKGRGKRAIILWPGDWREFEHADGVRPFEPDLMYLCANNLVIGMDELTKALADKVTK